jgi:hypothetical protein
MTATDTSTTETGATETGTRQLPEDFADLQQFDQWVLETQTERYDLRLATSMETMQVFYDAALPRLEAMLEYCDRYALDDLPDDVRNLMLLILGLMEVSFSIERWRQGRVPDSGSAVIYMVREPGL